jgi:hypothetical protein
LCPGADVKKVLVFFSGKSVDTKEVRVYNNKCKENRSEKVRKSSRISVAVSLRDRITQQML